MNQRELKVGGVYRHFNGGLYRVECIALHSETSEELVIYRSLKDYKVWARPIMMFLSEVDHNKYPAIKQKYRFTYLGDSENSDEITHVGYSDAQMGREK